MSQLSLRELLPGWAGPFTRPRFLAVIIRYEVEIVVPEFNAVKDVIRVTRVFGFEGLCTYEVEGFVEGHRCGW